MKDSFISSRLSWILIKFQFCTSGEYSNSNQLENFSCPFPLNNYWLKFDVFQGKLIFLAQYPFW
jgi:hypothetical protein